MLSEPPEVKSLVPRTCRLTVARRGLNVLAPTPFGASEPGRQRAMDTQQRERNQCAESGSNTPESGQDRCIAEVGSFVPFSAIAGSVSTGSKFVRSLVG
jgi:hypothetical protein